ncbi:YdeI/OmpD-associated family protein [Flavobacterium sufflavum]|uniref:YdeI/OmpD-associated family protein n=1 Tax=Flavobacterium sufflavum TaxID=1921138 RepID=UPI0026BFE611|nr:YdeI/OmpD-associated family protein [Flavobacterium sufflavum]
MAFAKNPVAFSNYENFSKSYKKNYLHWLNQAKRVETRQNRIAQIIDLCERNCKARQ